MSLFKRFLSALWSLVRAYGLLFFGVALLTSLYLGFAMLNPGPLPEMNGNEFPIGRRPSQISILIAKKTNQNVRLNFDSLHLGLWPIGVGFREAQLGLLKYPNLKMDQIFVSPSLIGLIQKQPYGSLEIENLWQGDIELTSRRGKKSEEESSLPIRVDFQGKNIQLAQALKDLKPSETSQGLLSVQGDMDLYYPLKNLPEGNVSLYIQNLKLASRSLPTNFGPLALPNLNLKTLRVIGHSLGNQVYLDSVDIGEGGDEITGKVKGSITTNILPNGMAQFGNYSFEVRLRVSQSLLNRLGSLGSLVDQFIPADAKSTIAGGTEYRMKVSGLDFRTMAKMEPLH